VREEEKWVITLSFLLIGLLKALKFFFGLLENAAAGLFLL